MRSCTDLSSGAAYVAAGWERRRTPYRTVVFIAAGTGHRYVDTVFSRHHEAAALDDLAHPAP